MHVLFLTINPADRTLFNQLMPTFKKPCNFATFDSIGEMWSTLSAQRDSFPNLIFLDIEFSRSYDHQVLEFLKNNDYLQAAPVVVLAESADSAEIFYAYQSHAACVLVLPTDGESRRKTIEACLGYWCNSVVLPRCRRGVHAS
jgi:hypothetical protein